MLLLFELQIQRILNDATIGLPYWDWAADGALPPFGQVGTALWQNSGIGGTGRPVRNGPFRANEFRVRIESNAFAALRTTDRGLNRELGADPDAPPCRRLPARSTLWGKARTTQRRGAGLLLASVTGWRVGYPSVCTIKSTLDRRRHGTGHSPNDPVFYLNHCNVDRIWEAWLVNQG